MADRFELTRMVRESSAYDGVYRRIVEPVAMTADQIGADGVFVAEREGTLLGFHAVHWREDGPELDYMFVADDAHRGGVGRVLFDHMCLTCARRGASEVRIVAHPPAEAFYLRMGAVRVGTKPPGGNATWDRPILRLDIRSGSPGR